MHFLSREIILHVWFRWWCFLRPFRRNKGQIFQPIAQAWHRNEAPKSAFWFSSVHTGSIGTSGRVGTRFRYPTLFITQICTLMDDSTFASRKSSLRASIWCIYLHFTKNITYALLVFNPRYTVSHRSEYTPHIFVNILLYLFMWHHWRNYTFLHWKSVECTACMTM